MSEPLNLTNYDPFKDLGTDQTDDKHHIHIRLQQRNGRKTLTTIEGLGKFDQKKLLRQFKIDFACNGTVVVDAKAGECIQLQGDHRKLVQAFLIKHELAKKADIKVHGF